MLNNLYRVYLTNLTLEVTYSTNARCPDVKACRLTLTLIIHYSNINKYYSESFSSMLPAAQLNFN